MACLFKGAYLLVEMFGNNRKGEKLMKFAGAPGKPCSLLSDFFFFKPLPPLHWSFSLLSPVLASDLY